MADINGAAFYALKHNQFDEQATSARFQADYIKAVNLVLTDIGNRWDFSTKPTRITSHDGDIDLDEKYENALFWGVDFYLITMGHRSGDLSLDTAERRFGEANALVDERQHHDNQQTTSADVIGLGYQS